jgi:hypothetical protein
VSVSGLPFGHALACKRDLIGGDACADVLSIGHVPILVGTTRCSGEVKPEKGFDIVAVHALADGVEQPQRCLSGRIALLGGLAVPRGSLSHVAGYAPAVAITLGELNLGFDVSRFGGFAVPVRSN